MTRREFLYEIRFWEVRRIIRGYRKRDRLTHQLLAEVYEAAKYANPYRKHDGKTVTDMFPQVFEDDDIDDESPISEDEEADLQALMAQMNEQSETQP